MSVAVFTPRAREDLVDLWVYIGAQSPQSADRMVEKIRAACAARSRAARAGLPRPDVGRGVRSLAVWPYVVLYREQAGGIRVLRVVHGAQRMPLVGDD